MANHNINPEVGKATQFVSGKKAAEAGRIGGIKSGQKRAEKVLLKTILEIALSTKSDKNQKDGNKYIDIIVGLINEAEKGNPKAFEVIRDTLGQKPIEQVQNINPPQIVIERPKE